MSDHGRELVLGAVVAILGGYAGVLAATTQFQPATPDRSDGVAFIHDYYDNVTDPSKMQELWDEKLDTDFKRNLKELQDSNFNGYEDFWKKYESVKVDKVEHAKDSEEFKVDLTYTFKKTHKQAPLETTYFTLRCPGWTAFTIFGCNEDNVRIHDAHD